MTLDEFVTQLKRDADDFKQRWLDGVAESPEDYPMELDEGDWSEQYLAEFYGHV